MARSTREMTSATGANIGPKSNGDPLRAACRQTSEWTSTSPVKAIRKLGRSGTAG